MTGQDPLSAGDTSHLIAQRRKSMCGKKAPYRTRAAAEKVAAPFKQRVYECPICFCWHCTSKETWRDEFVRIEEAADLVNAARSEFNAERKGYNRAITTLQQEASELRKRIRQLESG